MTAEQKAHVLTQLDKAEASAAAARGLVLYLHPSIISTATLKTAHAQIVDARERLEIAQCAIEGLIKEDR